MTKVKLNLASGSVQERELITAFNYNNVKYVIFDGESTGSMGLPIILVGKENFGKIVGITDAEEWKNTKDCLKKIIAGESVEYASINNELKADDIYYRQLTLPIASFDVLKSSYKAPEVTNETETKNSDDTPIFQPITPEEVVGQPSIPVEAASPNDFSQNIDVNASNEPQLNMNFPSAPQIQDIPAVEDVKTDIPVNNTNDANIISEPVNYDELKKEFLIAAETLFDNIFEKFNHKD